jgi:hypothetical protein
MNTLNLNEDEIPIELNLNLVNDNDNELLGSKWSDFKKKRIMSLTQAVLMFLCAILHLFNDQIRFKNSQIIFVSPGNNSKSKFKYNYCFSKILYY